MRPRVKSYGESSTATLSPARMRMKFLRILPETCARTWCLFSSSTRNIALGNGSMTVAMTSMASSLGLPESLFFFSSSCFAISLAAAGLKTRHYIKLPGRAGNGFRPREDPRTVRRDRHGVLEMRRRASVGGFGDPLVAHAHIGTSGIDHRLDRDDHTFLQSRAAPRFAVIREVRFIVHFGADAVPDEFADDRKTILFDQTLDRVADIAEAIARPHLLDGAVERIAGNVEELLQLRVDAAHGHGDSRIRIVAVDFHAEVDGYDVAFAQLALGRRNAVNDLAVHGGTEHARVPPIALERCVTRLAADFLLGGFFEIHGRDARADHFAQRVQDFVHDQAGAVHFFEFVGATQTDRHGLSRVCKYRL